MCFGSGATWHGYAHSRIDPTSHHTATHPKVAAGFGAGVMVKVDFLASRLVIRAEFPSFEVVYNFCIFDLDEGAFLWWVFSDLR